MDINSYIQRSKRTLDDIWDVVQRTNRELEDTRQRNRFLEQSNVDLNADITRFRLENIRLRAEIGKLTGQPVSAEDLNKSAFYI